tara:strand:+ start:78 stop:248 length:171 start_codon:yes stop_codon:yes gene_type:complete
LGWVVVGEPAEYQEEVILADNGYDPVIISPKAKSLLKFVVEIVLKEVKLPSLVTNG